MDLGLLVLRGVVGLTLAAHGAQKVFGWFGGGGPDGTAAFLSSLGVRSPRRAAVLAGTTELVAGLALAAGLATAPAAALIVAVMAAAAMTAHRAKGFFAADGGWEYPLVLGGAATAVAITGPGGWSLDAVLGTILDGPVVGAVAALTGMVVASVAVAALTSVGSRLPVRVRTSRTARTS